MARPLCALPLPADVAVSTGEPGEEVGVSSEVRLGEKRVKASGSWGAMVYHKGALLRTAEKRHQVCRPVGFDGEQ